MIRRPDRDAIVDLLGNESGQCVSIVMRTHQRGRATTQNPIRFKNLVNEAIERVGDSNQSLRNQLEKLSELEHDFDFWQHQSAGLAIYLCDGYQQQFMLPHTPEEIVYVADHFYALPLATAVCGSGGTRTLALSWERARLFQSDGHETFAIENESFPVTMSELVTERDPEEQLQFSTHSPKGGGPSGPSTGSVAMYHGHGEGEDKIEADRDAYLSRVGRLVADEIYNTDHPLIVFATDEVAGQFKATTKVDVAEVISGSPDGMDDNDVLARIGEVSHELIRRSDDALKERLGTAIANGRGSSATEEIVVQAASGRIDTLLLAGNAKCPGTFDQDKQEVHRSKDAQSDLVNVAVCETIKSGGTVVQLRDDEESDPVSAIYRY